jgi:1-pyrroline-5-carboxylate dehydrogenase
MINAKASVPFPLNEPVLSYAPGTQERQELKAKLSELKEGQIEIPLIINGKEVKTGKLGRCVLPHDHETVIGIVPQGRRKGGADSCPGRFECR